MAELSKRHRYLAVSLAVHAALIALAYYVGFYRIELLQQQDLIRAGAELSKQSSLDTKGSLTLVSAKSRSSMSAS